MVVMQALFELQAVLADSKSTAEQIEEKVAAVREARRKARIEFEEAEKDLLLLLTLDQVAVLTELGYLD
ncbi:MAG TPA: hypothetical protein PKY77_12755 [Phycisphaerae bacterium]|nr:hypothetical protein [Phycisphaerae bacterium]HRY69199.1 hypothetical protein [Phycisphaerae bacterium]HSA26160.1 hypothetical protein [Phycisphaerae bacterium]